MALERPPATKWGKHEDLKKFRPADDITMKFHTVTEKMQGFLWLSQKYNVTPNQIIGLNFPGAIENGRIIPEVVNWYLRHHNEFDCPETFDKKNRVFKGGEKIAIPKRVLNIEDPFVIVAPSKKTNIWIGAGYKGGTMFAVIGNEVGKIVCTSLDEPLNVFSATSTGDRVGLGIGASGSPMIVVITSMKNPQELNGLMNGGAGYNIALGPKLSSFLKAGRFAPLLGKLEKYAEVIGKGGKVGKGIATVAEYNSQIVDLVKMAGMETDADEPQILTIESPVGGFGGELSVVYTVTTWHFMSFE